MVPFHMLGMFPISVL